MNHRRDLVDVAPLLLPADCEGLVYAGFITSGSENFYIKITLQCLGTVKDARIDCDWRLKYLLKGYESIIQKRLEQSTDLTSFVLEFNAILDKVVQCSSALLQAPPPSFYTDVVKDLEVIGWSRVANLDQHFRDLKIISRDEADRKHMLSIHLSEKHPHIAPVCSACLPAPFQPSWNPFSTLLDLVRQFEDEITRYQEFWDVVGELDSKTWILEPENPSFSCTYRRIVIDTNLSVHVTLDPLKPNGLPECRFLGPDHAIAPLIEKLRVLETSWSENLSLLDNLQPGLGVTFPSTVTTEREEFSSECGICYMEHHVDTSSVPDTSCPNRQCDQSYHFMCLHEWLNTLPTSSKSFGMLKGECPYCGSGLSIKAISE